MTTGLDMQNRRLLDLGFRQFIPAAQLQKYVQCFWVVRQKVKPATPVINRLAPDGGLGIMFNLASPFHRYDRDKTHHCVDRSVITGTTKNAVNMYFDGEVNAVGVRFHPGGAYPFIRIPLHELTDHVVTPLDIGLPIREADIDKLACAASTEQKVNVLQNLLLSRLAGWNQKNDSFLQSIALIQKYRGTIKIKEVADIFGMSIRSYQRHFKTQVGLTPKMFSRIVRIQAARQHIKKASLGSLTGVGYAASFYDQAHFIREFKSIMDLTPKEYLFEKQALSPLCNS